MPTILYIIQHHIIPLLNLSLLQSIIYSFNPHTMYFMIQHHPFHLAQLRPWPILGSIRTARIISALIFWFNISSLLLLPIPLLTSILIFLVWWRDVSREATFNGNHTMYAQEGLEWGIILFITSEIIFFSAFFWTFYHRRLAPNIELGAVWPPIALSTLNPFSIPLLNTIILLYSGITVTITHNLLTSPPNKNNKLLSSFTLLITILLGIYFTLLQAYEYKSALFTLSDSIFGSIFFIATGFHGLHVIVGAIFLSVTLLRLLANHFSPYHHFGFEAATWYWHFVDVVWIFLYINLYWWRSK